MQKRKVRMMVGEMLVAKDINIIDTIRYSMAECLNIEKVVVNVELKDDAKDVFLKLKKKLNMESSSDVVRYALTFAEKRTK